MAISIVMPALEMAQETGKLVSWIKKEGSAVGKGEPLLEIETDKAVMEIESPAEGILAGVKAQAGDVVPVGQVIGWIVKPGESPPAEEAQAVSGRKSTVETGAAAPAAQAAMPSASHQEARISPKARRLAKENGIDIATLRGSGPEGEITTADVLAAGSSKPAPASAAPASSSPALGPIARLMAERTTQSWTTVPHFFVTREIDATALNQARTRLSSAVEHAKGVKITHTDLLVALVARVLVKHAALNSSWVENSVRTNPDVNIAIAMAVGEGVVGAVVPKADAISLGEIAVQRRDLTERARAGKLRPADITGATFTISNLGMYKVDSFSAIISPPQAAILAVGVIQDRVVAIDGKVEVRPRMSLTLSSDHRVVDGARAAEFLNALAEAIQQPDQWLS